MLNTLVIIPARYASTRFPGKPLALLGGKPIIQHVIERAREIGSRVLVATDDERIAELVRSLQTDVVMTSSAHRSGTDRIIEAYQLAGRGEDVVLNLQGDEPFIHPESAQSLIQAFEQDTIDIATLAEPLSCETSDEDLLNPNNVKVVRASNGRALYFSRSCIPHLRGVERDFCRHHQYYKHIGLYAFRVNILDKLATLSASDLEVAESLEQLRWLESGYTIQLIESRYRSIGIDTPEDLEVAENYLYSLSK